MKSYNTYSFVPHFICSALCLQDSSMLLCVVPVPNLYHLNLHEAEIHRKKMTQMRFTSQRHKWWNQFIDDREHHLWLENYPIFTEEVTVRPLLIWIFMSSKRSLNIKSYRKDTDKDTPEHRFLLHQAESRIRSIRAKHNVDGQIQPCSLFLLVYGLK